MKFLIVFIFFISAAALQAQPISTRLTTAVNKMQADEQFAHASIGFYVINSKTGAIVFDKNSQLGLAPASTQKVVTSAAAYALLGKDFMYKSQLGYEGNIINGVVNGRLIFTGSGDPTSGSWRWKQTNETSFKENLLAILKKNSIRSVNGGLLVNESIFESQATPNGWTWDDIGNYYGAGVWGVNWNENKYDIFLKPGKNVGDPVQILSTEPTIAVTAFRNELKTAKSGSGDHSIIYLPENGIVGILRGTVPAQPGRFTISGSIPDAPRQMAMVIDKILKDAGISISGGYATAMTDTINRENSPGKLQVLGDFISPSFDSMNYWFMKESINLYGEAFVKTIAHQKKGFGSTAEGLDIITGFWKSTGIHPAALKMKDGSGLSPANRLTPRALVAILQYASKESWFNSFYHSLPLQNNIKMKSGYIGGVRSYTGFIKSKTGDEYTFAFIINNFDGSPAAVREKMWKILDLLK